MASTDSGAPSGQVQSDAGQRSASGVNAGRTALLGAVTTLVATLTVIATVNGDIARMFRNHQLATVLALILELVAILCGLLTQIHWPMGSFSRSHGWPVSSSLLVVGSVALVFGLGLAVVAEVRSLALSDRPAVTATFAVDGSAVDFKAHVISRKAKAHDQIVVTVYGVAPNGQRGSVLYYAKSGPTTEGELTQDIDLILDGRMYGGAYLSANVVSENVLPPEIDCDGNIVRDDGTNLMTDSIEGGKAEPVPFRPGGRPPLVGCLTITFPSASR
jgi:hypothetical protein